jgi:hypothetical protein
MPKKGGSKGDVPGQKYRARERARERAKRDPEFAEHRRALRRGEKARARARQKEQKQWSFGGAKCRACGGTIEDNALFCRKVACNPSMSKDRLRIINRT